MMDLKGIGVNPYLPSWEYIPDGEPHVFGERVYVYGSHDRFNGYMYCLNDYVCWSASIYDLTEWKYEGVIFKKTDDPDNPDGTSCLFAPDVCRGSDDRYYLYYVLHDKPYVSVAVSDVPQGPYEYYGIVQDENGEIIGLREGDEPQFDPGVLNEGDITYLYTGFCPIGDTSRSGPMVMKLGSDMITVLYGPEFIMPSEPFSEGSGYEGHEFFEAPSIRKVGDKYYFVYSSIKMYELCYAISDDPLGGFTYGGVIISNNDIGIDSYKPKEKPTFYGGNNHGGMEKINDDWYIFYHRHTNGTNYSRQACAEKIQLNPDGSIDQVQMTSSGMNDGPLPGKGRYPAHIACNLFCSVDNAYTGGMGGNGLWLDSIYPKITQDGADGDECDGYILNMTDDSTAGFKYFSIGQPNEFHVWTRGYARGTFEVRTSIDGEILATVPISSSALWKEHSAQISIDEGIHPIYLTYRGTGNIALHSFEIS